VWGQQDGAFFSSMAGPARRPAKPLKRKVFIAGNQPPPPNRAGFFYIWDRPCVLARGRNAINNSYRCYSCI
jgi:hypothetical protein